MRTTARGTGLLTAAATLLGAGFTFGYPELAGLGTAAVVALVVAALHTLWQPRLESTRTAEPDRVGRGEPAFITLTVRNRDRMRSATLVAEDRCGGRPVPVPVLRLRPGRDTTVRYPVPTRHRGVVPVGPLRIVRVDPLGLVRLVRSHPGTSRVWVHPHVHPMTAVPAGAARSMDGRSDRVPHGSITFDSLRKYVVGDELRRVHWRTSARAGELMVREHVDTSLPRLVILLDNRAEAHPQLVDGVAETFESACEAAASIVAAAGRNDVPVVLHLINGDSLGGHEFDRLAAAALCDAPHGDGLLRTAALRLRQRRSGDTLVFLTGPGTALEHIGALRGACSRVIAGVFAAPGTAPGVDPTVPGQLAGVLINAVDGAEFAAEWDCGVGRW